MESGKISRISLEIIVWFVILGAFLCISTSITGYLQYNSNIRKIYNVTAYDIAETALSYTSADELSRLAKLARGYSEGRVSEAIIKEEIASSRYQELSSQITSLRESMGANDVMIFCVDIEELDSYSGAKEDWCPILYLVDSYPVPDLSFELGGRGAFNPKYIDELSRIARTGERVKSYFISNGDYGYITSALLPVPTGGDVVIIAVEIPMRTLNSALRGYIIGALAVTLVVVASIIVIFFLGFEKRFVAPIKRMADAASDFISGEANGAMTSSIATLVVLSNDELCVLCDSLKQMEKNIISYMNNLQTITAERERIGTELDVARHIQTSMLPCIFPAFPEREDFDIFAVMTPAKEVGGDFYDFFMVDETHIAIVMADVSGKGVPAALFMVIAKTLIKDHTQPGVGLDAVFEEVNELLCEANSEGLFVTAFEGVLDLETGRLSYVNAGHEMPFLCSGGRFEAKKVKPGFVLAGMEGMRYTMGEFTLQPGDKIFQYTDGIPEAMTAARDLYGMERLAAALNRHADLSPQAIIAAVMEDVDAFVAGAPQFDDITMLCLEFKKRLEKANQMEKKISTELTLDATIENIERVTSFVDELLEAALCPRKALAQINIAIDELFGNIAHYAYNPKTGPATVRVEASKDEVAITFIDGGAPYNPLSAKEPDIALLAEERGIGGLGIYMVKSIMDDITYEYEDGKNILTIRKEFSY